VHTIPVRVIHIVHIVVGAQITAIYIEKISAKFYTSYQIRVVSKRDVVAVVKIGNEKYNLYPTQDIEITATEKPNLTYSVTLQDGVNRDSRGKVVGKYTATDGKIEVSGDLIMR